MFAEKVMAVTGEKDYLPIWLNYYTVSTEELEKRYRNQSLS